MINVTVTLPDAVRDAANRQHQTVEWLVQRLVDAYLEELEDDAIVTEYEAREASGLTRVRDVAAFEAEMDPPDHA